MIQLKKILSVIWKFINSKYFPIAVIVLLLMFSAQECKRIKDLKRDISEHEQNINALTDSLKYEKTRNGALLVSIDGYIATEKELKTINAGLWKSVNDQKGKVLSLTNAVLKLKVDSTELAKHIDQLKVYIGELVKIDTNHFEAPWVLPYSFDKDNSFSVVGKTRIGVLRENPLYLVHDTTYLIKFENQIKLTWGQKVENGKLRIFVETKFPGFTVGSLEGVLIDPSSIPGIIPVDKKHWFSGWSLGASITPGWDIINAKPTIVIGPSLHYSIYQW
jgi:hypothetical protein